MLHKDYIVEFIQSYPYKSMNVNFQF